MPAIGIGITWFGYSVALWGYCLLRGYDVSFTQLVNPAKFYSGKWPPPQNIPPNQILPGQASGTSSATASKSSGKPGNPASNPNGVVAGGHGR